MALYVFPATVDVEKQRYPEISSIVNAVKENGLNLKKIDSTDKSQEHCISIEFLNLVENKGFSMFDLIDDVDFNNGLVMLKQDYENQIVLNYIHGETFIWITKSK